ncbi:MAG: hypothetical protein R3F59_18670 [Myxococcota bacterium]
MRAHEAATRREVRLGAAQLAQHLLVFVDDGGGDLLARHLGDARVGERLEVRQQVDVAPGFLGEPARQAEVAEGGDPPLLAERAHRGECGRHVEVAREDHRAVEDVAHRERDNVGHERGVDHLLFGVGDDLVAVRALARRRAPLEPVDEEAGALLDLLQQVGERVAVAVVVRARDARVVVGPDEARPLHVLDHPLRERAVVEPLVPRRAAQVLHVVLAVEEQRDAHAGELLPGKLTRTGTSSREG